MPLPRTLLALAAGALLTVPALAQSGPSPSLALQLNALSPVEGACRVTFVATNDLRAAVDDATFELGFFGKDGVLQRLVSLDFKAMPKGKTKVLQFDLQGLVCGDIGRVLVNDVGACDGDGLDPATCLAALTTTSLPGIAFGT